MIALWIVLGILAVVVLYVISTYNGFVRLRNTVEEAFSTMDVYLKKRYDLIPNIVETVKGYAKHESETLEAVINARNKAVSAQGDSRIEAEGELNNVMSRLFALTESYPDLKANTNFLDLQGELKKIETEIAQSRKYYNGTAARYNIKCETFPSVFVANIFGFTRKPLYEVSNEAERENVKVQF